MSSPRVLIDTRSCESVSERSGARDLDLLMMVQTELSIHSIPITHNINYDKNTELRSLKVNHQNEKYIGLEIHRVGIGFGVEKGLKTGSSKKATNTKKRLTNLPTPTHKSILSIRIKLIYSCPQC